MRHVALFVIHMLVWLVSFYTVANIFEDKQTAMAIFGAIVFVWSSIYEDISRWIKG